MAKGVEASAEKVVKDIRRKTRGRFSAEEKIRIVLEGLRPPSESCRQAADKGSENETKQDQRAKGGPSRTRSWNALAEIFKKNEKLGAWPGRPMRPDGSFRAEVTPERPHLRRCHSAAVQLSSLRQSRGDSAPRG